MNLTLDYLKSNRKWLVPNVVVWGNADACEAALLMVEDDSPARVVFSYSRLEGNDQVINFGDLTDADGNSLPSQISKPVVIVIPGNQMHCFIVGRPSETGFKLAYSPDSNSSNSGYGLVDLLIMEIDRP